MERAVFITNLDQLRFINRNYSRLYYGNEFCERLIPSVAELKQVVCYVKKNKLGLTLVTPYVTNEGFKKTEELCRVLKKYSLNCEIVINDFGVLDLINNKYPGLTPALGRLLNKQKRGPGLSNLLNRETKAFIVKDQQNPKAKHIIFKKKLPLGLDYYYKGSNASSVPVIHKFLLTNRIKRIELDNTEQGLLLDLPKGRILASIYTPYVYISTTFFCPTAGCDKKKKSLLKIKPCGRECRKYIFELRHRSIPRVIYVKGNTHFYKNARMQIKEWGRIGVDRIVYEPQIPV